MRRRRVDLSTRVGSVELSSPVLTASGTSGHGAELAAYLDLSRLGAVVVKSLAFSPHAGNPPPRLRPCRDGLLNSVGLQGGGICAFLADDLPHLLASGARVVVSIWGRNPEEFAAAASAIADAPREVVAVEVNLSCPNLDGEQATFSSSPDATAAVVEAASACLRPRWAKLSPVAPDLVAVARSALASGAEALTLTNTLPAGDLGDAPLGVGQGGLSGPALRPIALRAVAEVAAALPGAQIVGAGGVATASDALELLAAGARAVEVGTASFVDPRAAGRVLAGLERLAARSGAASLAELWRESGA